MVFMLLIVKIVTFNTLDRQKSFQLDAMTIDARAKKFDISTQNYSTTLLQHYKSNHNFLLVRRPSSSQCLSVIFVEEPFVCLFVCLLLLFLWMEVRHERQFGFMPSI